MDPAFPKIYIGTHMPHSVGQLDRAMVSFNVLERRKKDISPNEWILDSGAFTRIVGGKGHIAPEDYAVAAMRWRKCGTLVAVVQQDFMCEPVATKATGLTVREHQIRTTENYLRLLKRIDDGTYVMPVIQGFQPSEYEWHVQQLAPYLERGQWVGVGSVCKRQGKPSAILDVLRAVHSVRPDLRLHGFGVKATSMRHREIRRMFHSIDSMAWSFAARYGGRDQNDIQEAIRWRDKLLATPLVD